MEKKVADKALVKKKNSKTQMTAKRRKSEQAACKITDMDMYLFGMGTHYDMFRKLGSHQVTIRGKQGVHFAVWAPGAVEVRVIGEFNDWDESAHLMKRLEPAGIYELFIPGVKEGSLYKYMILTSKGEKKYKADPYANYAEYRPGTASRVTDITQFQWTDENWIEKRKVQDTDKMPMTVYEVHLGSWKKHIFKLSKDDEDAFYSYRELAHELAKYVKEMGYTHIEIMGLLEHPYDGSWGYQVTGYFAPTARYGTPADFAYFVDYMHKNKIGVILDWVPAHFPKDAHGLAEFDGTCLYEYADPRQGEHPDWGTKVFDYGKSEVKNFLIGNALFWVEQYHIDGLRVDAVASMLYLDYGKQDGGWIPNKHGDNKNLEAIELFKHLNSILLGRNHGTVMIAEESTAWPKVTGQPEDGGLGFSLKWNMGWMHDFLEYMKLDPYFRKFNHHKMTFAMSYAYSENYVLVLSHDEVVHGKATLLGKMYGESKEKFDNLKVAYGFMFGHPGKKLLFMGQEFAQIREWSEKRELDWFLLEEEKHAQIHQYVKDLLKIYNKHPSLYELDMEQEGFEWINANDGERSIFSFIRKSSSGKKNLLFVCNFTPVERPEYRVGVHGRKQCKLILNSDAVEYGGSGKKYPESYRPQKKECDGRAYSFAFPLPAYGMAIFEF